MSNKKYALIGILSGLVNGLIGGGGGMVIVPVLSSDSLYGQKKAQATAMAVMTPVSVFSATLCLTEGIFPFKKGLAVLSGVVLGGIIGANALRKIKQTIIEKIFYSLISVLSVKMLIC